MLHSTDWFLSEIIHQKKKQNQKSQANRHGKRKTKGKTLSCLSVPERRPEVPVVETTPSSIGTFLAVASSLQLSEPTNSECAAFATIGDVMRWARLPSGSSNAAVCKRQSFLSVFGAEETDHVRVLANLPADQFEELLKDWKFEDASPPAAR